MLVAAVAMAQEETIADALAQQKKEPLFRNVAVGVDVIGAAMRTFGDQGDYQATVTAAMKGGFFPVVEIGMGKSDKHDTELYPAYKSSGMFGKIGVDYNMLNNKKDDYRLTIGARYGITHFDSEATTFIDSLRTDVTTLSETCTVHTLELVAGVDAKVWGPLHMGWSLRYRRRLKNTDYVNVPIYAPGYGNVYDDVTFMALYTISLQF